MNLSNQRKKKGNLLPLFVLFIFYLIFLFSNRQKLFQKFDPDVINRYLRSQDIEDVNNLIKDRIFISDEEIYIASGYLYASGAKPTEYNLHPPFVKYLFGFSAKHLNMPLFPNVIFAGLLLFEVYLLGNLILKNKLVGFLASFLLLFDPVFKEVTIYALLDLGQMVFILAFIVATLFKPKNFILSGILLGLAAASKFYSPVVFYFVVIYLYKLILASRDGKIFRKEFYVKEELLCILIGLLTFSLIYYSSFPFNIFFYQAKLIKFMLDHNTAVAWGGVIKMFFGGYFMWPILFIVNLYQFMKFKMDRTFIVGLLPLLYFVLLTFQLPFTRYFILILPFLYLSLTNFVIKIYNTCYKFKG